MASALDKSKAASIVAKSLVELLSIAGPIGVLSGLFVCVSALSAVIRCALADHVFCCAHVHRSNAATVTLMFPVASLFVGPETQVSLKATLYVLMMAASSSFSTPIGYQTNLMVVGPGGYHALDFARFGLPLTLISLVISVALAHLLFGGDSTNTMGMD